ncbi:MAG: MFS transporter [Telmatospirillum sp.]|nr:MFS transporter [Telmatospirillum sp.]
MARARPSPALVVTASAFGFALIQLDVTIVNVALPRIGAELATGVDGLQWVVDAYALVFSALLLSAGFLGDRFGARRVYLAGVALFALASLICGMAGGAGGLITGRVLQGIAAAAMLPASLALLNHALGHDAGVRAWAVGWWTAAGSVTIAAGPVVGGLLLGVGGWRSIFLVNLPLCLIGAVLIPTVPETPKGPGRGVDLPGQGLCMLALAGLIAAVIEARPLGLAHPLVLGCAGVGVAASAGFLLVEAKSGHPMLPLSLFRVPGFGVCVLYGMVVNLTYYGTVFILSLYLQRVLGYLPLEAGLAYLPLTATFVVVNVLSGRVVTRFGHRRPMIWGALVDATGFALLLSLGPHSAYWAMILPFALMPAGMGTGVPAMTTAVLSAVPKHQSGIGSAVLNAARQAAGAMGVALFGALAGEGTGDGTATAAAGMGDGVVRGLHLSALVAIGLLVTASILAARVMPAGFIPRK